MYVTTIASDATDVYLFNLCVAVSHRQRGLAVKLMRFAEREARARNLEGVAGSVAMRGAHSKQLIAYYTARGARLLNDQAGNATLLRLLARLEDIVPDTDTTLAQRIASYFTCRPAVCVACGAVALALLHGVLIVRKSRS